MNLIDISGERLPLLGLGGVAGGAILIALVAAAFGSAPVAAPASSAAAALRAESPVPAQDSGSLELDRRRVDSVVRSLTTLLDGQDKLARRIATLEDRNAETALLPGMTSRLDRLEGDIDRLAAQARQPTTTVAAATPTPLQTPATAQAVQASPIVSAAQQAVPVAPPSPRIVGTVQIMPNPPPAVVASAAPPPSTPAAAAAPIPAAPAPSPAVASLPSIPSQPTPSAAASEPETATTRTASAADGSLVLPVPLPRPTRVDVTKKTDAATVARAPEPVATVARAPEPATDPIRTGSTAPAVELTRPAAIPPPVVTPTPPSAPAPSFSTSLSTPEPGRLGGVPLSPDKTTTATVPPATAATRAPQQPVARTSFGVDLGIGAPATLSARWKQLAKAQPQLVANLTPMLATRNGDSGPETHLLAGPFANAADAAIACARLKQTGAICRTAPFAGDKPLPQ